MNTNKIIRTSNTKNICEEITKTLPMWFGISDANEKYANDANIYSSLCIKDDEKDIALLVYKKTLNKLLKKEVIDIHWLGIIPEYHRKGLGTKLFNELCLIAKSENIDTITVETLDPAVKDECYLKTVSFYESLGFEISEHFHDECKMVRMVVKIS